MSDVAADRVDTAARSGDPVAERGTDWALSAATRPPTIGELVERIDEALAVARGAEVAAVAIGDAALDAAEQARRAAELAERASATTTPAGRVSVAPAPGIAPNGARPPAEPGNEGSGEHGMRDFSARADRISARLRQLERLPLAAAG